MSVLFLFKVCTVGIWTGVLHSLPFEIDGLLLLDIPYHLNWKVVAFIFFFFFYFLVIIICVLILVISCDRILVSQVKNLKIKNSPNVHGALINTKYNKLLLMWHIFSLIFVCYWLMSIFQISLVHVITNACMRYNILHFLEKLLNLILIWLADHRLATRIWGILTRRPIRLLNW